MNDKSTHLFEHIKNENKKHTFLNIEQDCRLIFRYQDYHLKANISGEIVLESALLFSLL